MRKRLFTRTCKLSKANCIMVDRKTNEISNATIVISGHYDSEIDFIKHATIQGAYCTDTHRIVVPNNIECYEENRAMLESEFVKNSFPNVKADKETEN